MPWSTEIDVLLPNYFQSSQTGLSGFTAVQLGIKHELHDTKTWMLSLEGFIIPSSGGKNRGTEGMGGYLDSIIAHDLGYNLSFTGLFGVSSQTVSTQSNGQRYTSFNPDGVLTWSFKEKWELLGEVYGQTHTGPAQGSGFNADAGLIYLPFKTLAVDLEVSQRLSGQLYGFEQYIGAGMAFRFL